jgi:hypothetical protein
MAVRPKCEIGKLPVSPKGKIAYLGAWVFPVLKAQKVALKQHKSNDGLDLIKAFELTCVDIESIEIEVIGELESE